MFQWLRQKNFMIFSKKKMKKEMIHPPSKIRKPPLMCFKWSEMIGGSDGRYLLTQIFPRSASLLIPLETLSNRPAECIRINLHETTSFK